MLKRVDILSGIFQQVFIAIFDNMHSTYFMVHAVLCFS